MSVEGEYKKLNSFYAGRVTDTENTGDPDLEACPNAMLIDSKLLQALDNRI